MKKVISVAASAQNLLKIAPIERAFKKYKKDFKHIICHVGPGVDEQSSLTTFAALDMADSDYYISCGAGSAISQTSISMLEFEKVLLEERPDLVLLSGHQNAMLGCGIAASKMNIPIAHIDAGLRNFDKNSHEEVNRILTDTLSDYHFVSEHSGMKNLRDEREDTKNIFFVGNTLVDSLELYWSDMEESEVFENLGIGEEEYLLVTFSENENIDNPKRLSEITAMLQRLAERCLILWPSDEIVQKRILETGLIKAGDGRLLLIPMQEYTDFLALMYHAEGVITDTSEIQEETTYLGAQCITIKKFTERIVTLDVGTNNLTGTDLEKAEKAINDLLDGVTKPGRIPEHWDGKASRRIVDIIVEQIGEETD